MNNPDTSKKEITRSRELLFKIISLSLPVLILLLLEGFLRLISYGDNLDLFITNPKDGYEHYLIVNPTVGKKYFQELEYDSPANDIFLKKKPKGTFRIFVMGSSTVKGFPFEYNLMFSRILQKRLEDVYPDRHIEVVNTAITAINSFTLLDYAGQIIKYDPDAVLLYAGHNEFYGAFGVGSNVKMSKSRKLTRLHLYLMDLRLYQLIRNITNSTIRKIGSGKSDQVHGTLMKRIVANNKIPYDSDDYKLAMKRYKQNMRDIIKKFKNRKIPIFLSDVVSNVKDIKPLSYMSTGSEDEAWNAYVRAEDTYENADYDRARQFYFEAKDLDGVRFRASEDLNHIIEELTREFETYYVPMLDLFQDSSLHNIVGNNLMTEHVHPNINGSFLMADAFYSEIVKSGILGEVDENLYYPPDYYKINWGYTALDSLLAHHRITNLKNYWPFVSFDADNADYRLVYHPGSKLDSIAFIAFKYPDQSLDDLRLDLAREYEAKGNHYAAYQEYEAMVCTNPYLAVNYRDAASSLINLGDLPLALKYYEKSLEYEQSFYASYRMGEIYLIKGDYINAIKRFEEAFFNTSEYDEQMKALGKIYVSSVYGNQKDHAQAIAQQLKRYNATQYLKIPPKTYTYDNYIPYKTRNQVNAARQMVSEGKFSEAISTLEGSLKIYDSHMAHRYLGEAYLKMGNNRMALNQLNRVYSEFSFDPEFLTSLIILNITLNNLQQAADLLDELKRIDPDYKSIAVIGQMLSQVQRSDK